MIPFFIILGIIFFNILIVVILCLSTLQINVKSLIYDSKYKINNFCIYIKLRFLGKITWAKIKLDDKGIKKYKSINNKILQKIKINIRNEIVGLKNITQIPFYLNKVDLKLELSLNNPFLTSLFIGLASTVVSIVIARKIKNFKIDNCKYIINPIFVNKLQLKINLKCIIDIKLVHIISIVYMLFKKGSGEFGKYSSNRRTYASGNE